MKKSKKSIAVIVSAVCAALIILAALIIFIIGKNSSVKPVRWAKEGDCVSFGSFEQDNDKSNGAEEIEWIVLAKEKNKLLIISRYALDCRMFNSEDTDSVWESCILRSWLNEDFLEKSFSDKEKAKITADKTVKDKVFVLSTEEAKKYFESDEARRCAPTKYAMARGALTKTGYKTDSTDYTSCYWLRDKGWHYGFSAMVAYGGDVYYRGEYVDEYISVRPAMWISTK